MSDSEFIEAGPRPGQPAGPASPAQLVVDGVQRCLALAASWPAWDGQPITPRSRRAGQYLDAAQGAPPDS